MADHVLLPDGTRLPAIGQGTWFMGENPSQRAAEVRALQQGLDAGMTLIDTAEMYADGGAEQVVGEAIAGRRDQVFLVSKVYPHHAGGKKAITACENSLQRLATEQIDLYLLHWRGGFGLDEIIEAMEKLQCSGKIARWGVSNLDTADMEELWQLPGGDQCQINQVLYHAASRGIEYDLLPWCRAHAVPVMAYCPLAQAGKLRHQLLEEPTLSRLATEHGVSNAEIALAWVIRSGQVIAIPKAVQPQHVAQNARALTLTLSNDDLLALDQAFPPPARKQPLDIV
ncbi:MAG: aldo/keto reductase [Yersiniaceae bacterium]|nr:aldo/keto reductase [Yersiniaceae bacterium]